MNTASSNKPRVGMVGIGLMGLGIATNVQNGGWPLNFLEHEGNQPTDDLVANGAVGYATSKDLAGASDVIIICVTGTPQVEEVLFNAQSGVLEGMKPGSVIIDCSTAIPSSTVKIANAVDDAGGRFMDAPMTRTPKEAMEGRLNLIVGGDRDLYDEQLPLLHSYAENVTYAGPVSSGHKLKLLHNYVSLGFSTVLAEAAACAEKGNVVPEVLVEVLSQGGGSGVILERFQPYLLKRDSSKFQFSISNAYKDISYYTAMADDLNAYRETASGILRVLETAKTSGHANDTVPELISIIS